MNSYFRQNPHRPDIAHSCPPIDAYLASLEDIRMKAEDIESLIAHGTFKEIVANIDDIVNATSDMESAAEKTREINMELRDHCLTMADKVFELEHRIEGLEDDLTDMERMLG